MTAGTPPRPGTPRDNAEACRGRAAANLLESVSMLNANQRIRLETSAASWTARADMLQRVEDGVERRAQAALAEPGTDAEPKEAAR